MLIKNITPVLLALGIFAIPCIALAQSDAPVQKEKNFVDRLDDFGKTIFGGVIPSDKSKKDAKKETASPKSDSKAYVKKPSVKNPYEAVDIPPTSTKRAGSILSDTGVPQQRVLVKKKNGADGEFMPENTPPAVTRSAEGTPKPMRRPSASAQLFDDEAISETPEKLEKEEVETVERKSSLVPVREEPVAMPTVVAEPPDVADNLADLPNTPQTDSRPLHERLTTARQSVFGAGDDSASAEKPSKSSAVQSKPAESKAPAGKAVAASPAATPILAQRVKPEESIATPPAAQTAPELPRNEPQILQPLAKPVEKAAPAMRPLAEAAEPMPKTIRPTTQPIEKTLAPARTDSEGDVLVSRRGPALSVETLGPRRIAIGKASTYEVNIQNSGESAAEDLVVFVSLPDWAEVAGIEASTGTAQANPAATQTAESLRWTIGRLDSKSHERLSLKIIPHQSKPLDLAIRWDTKPVASQASIEVQEAKLVLQLEGPRDVLYGKKEVYRLKLANSGNGAAEGVILMLMPIGGGENVPATHKLGMLAAGEDKTLDVELTARQAGNLTIQVEARADGGIHTELAEKVFVRRAGLKLDVEGPKMQFVGAATTYAVRVTNPGTAPAKNVKMAVLMPAGVKFLSGVDDARLDASGTKLEWVIESINPDVEQSFVLKFALGTAGVSRFQVSAAADDELTASSAAVTRVEAVANLLMEVKDPEGPVAVGDEAVYEVRIRNRGTKSADGVEVFAYFSRGIEPTEAEGSPNRLGAGQVTFQPIASLAPGAEMVFKVRAKAETSGNHIFRAEAYCKPLGARLIREATNLYYLDDPAGQQIAKQPNERATAEAMRPAPRPIRPEQSTAPLRK